MSMLSKVGSDNEVVNSELHMALSIMSELC